MPGGDGRGPTGSGPMTGKGMGYCVGQMPPSAGQRRGRGARTGFRCGAGSGSAGIPRGNPWRVPVSDRSVSVHGEIDRLRSEESALSESLKDVKERLSRLENENRQ